MSHSEECFAVVADLPLCLFDCEFEDVDWIYEQGSCSSVAFSLSTTDLVMDEVETLNVKYLETLPSRLAFQLSLEKTLCYCSVALKPRVESLDSTANIALEELVFLKSGRWSSCRLARREHEAPADTVDNTFHQVGGSITKTKPASTKIK